LENSTASECALSLLWPDGAPPAPDLYQHCDAAAIEDLDLEELVGAIASKTEHRQSIRTILTTLVDDPAVIQYRSQILNDLLNVPNLTACFENLLPQLGEIAHLSGPQRQAQTPLQQVLWRLGELEMYVTCVSTLRDELGAAREQLHSSGLRSLLAWAEETCVSASFRSLCDELPSLRKKVAGIRSLTVGINLDAQMRPIGAVLLEIRNEEFVERSLLDKLLKHQNEQQGIAALHTMPPPPRGLPGKSAFAGMSGDGSQPLMHPLFRDVNTVMMHAARPVADALQRYLQTNARALISLEQELVFYLGAVRLVERLRRLGLTMCRPDILPVEERSCVLKGSYNIALALRLGSRSDSVDIAQELVSNDVEFTERGRIFILTGPNRGGKTTYLQAVGQAHILAQAGLFVPAAEARLSPVRSIHTHFPAAEKATQERGRFGEEARRLSLIFNEASPYSLVLLNESLFSTSPGESLYLARDVVAALRLLGTRAIYATHLHELAEDLDALNSLPGSSVVVSLVAGVADDGDEASVRHTFIIKPGPPRGKSYARAIAVKYGISYDKLSETLRQRGYAGKPADLTPSGESDII